MTVIHLTGRITDDGKLEVELPSDLPVGEVDVALTIAETEQSDAPDAPDALPYTQEELDELLTFKGKTGAEIVKMLDETNGYWDRPDITDGQEFIEEQRRRQAEKRNIRW